jgi:hypothetical protein
MGKLSAVVGLLRREGGATIDQLAAAMDWLPHTTRAALTGLRKRGFEIDRRMAKDAHAGSYAIVDNPNAAERWDGAMHKPLRSSGKETARRPLPEVATGSVHAEDPTTATGLEAELAERKRLLSTTCGFVGGTTGAGLRRPLSLAAYSFASWPIAFRLRRLATWIGKLFDCWSNGK